LIILVHFPALRQSSQLDLLFCGVTPPGGPAYISDCLFGTGFVGFNDALKLSLGLSGYSVQLALEDASARTLPAQNRPILEYNVLRTHRVVRVRVHALPPALSRSGQT